MVRIVVSVLGLVSAAVLVCLAWAGWARKLADLEDDWNNLSRVGLDSLPSTNLKYGRSEKSGPRQKKSNYSQLLTALQLVEHFRKEQRHRLD